MKKQLMTILTVVLALVMIFTLAACEKKPDPNGSEPAPNKKDPAHESIHRRNLSGRV
jgi:uncharacterized lipoprotein YehR (DUF1307 family)